MGYYIRVLGERPEPPRHAEIRAAAIAVEPHCEVHLEKSADDGWVQIAFRHKAGPEILILERNLVREGELGADEVTEFIEEVAHYKPESAAQWLQQYLPKTGVIYAMQLLSGTDLGNGWAVVHAVQRTLWNHAGGILQADGEGFSNIDGYHILWQFSEKAAGTWNMAVLENGTWRAFQMDLGDKDQREAFLAGKVPLGAKLL
jgi:hypothetical protein